ncbi:MAG: hypothetical protein U0T81_13445 [Saprospiraceae bacterium]
MTISHAQLANGSPAPDFSVTDINGNGWSLYSEMSGGKSTCLDFFCDSNFFYDKIFTEPCTQ